LGGVVDELWAGQMVGNVHWAIGEFLREMIGLNWKA
jgi:hypothetical protein